MSKKVLFSVCIILLLTIVFQFDAVAQCPMCKIGAESNLRDGGTAGTGLNKGILYMFAMPYLIVATLGFIWYKNKKNYDSTDINIPE